MSHSSPALTALGVPHCFTTRRGPGGVDLELKGLGLGPHPAEARLLAALGLCAPARLVRARQIHGAEVFVVGRELPPLVPAADALIGSHPDRAVLVFSADCVPILLARADGRRVAAVHAGWRGLVAGAVFRAVEALRADSTSGPGSELVAAIGPCISLARFEVGPEVAETFRAVELGRVVHEGPPAERPHIDLRRAAAVQLARAGVARVDIDERCTWDDPELYSYRRDVTHGAEQATGRLAALVAPRRGRSSASSGAEG